MNLSVLALCGKLGKAFTTEGTQDTEKKGSQCGMTTQACRPAAEPVGAEAGLVV